MPATVATVKWPFGAASSATLSATGAQAITVKDNLTIIDGVTTEATGNRTLNLTLDAELEGGAMLLVQSKTNGTETTTFGTGITGPVITGVAGKTINATFIYNGTAFVQAGASVQID